MTRDLIDKIDALLPQTQCGLCGYGACRPYATAIATKNENIDRCPPGGVNTLVSLGKLLQKNVDSLLHTMQKKAKPPLLAVIREDECIGCTKCIQACPVDAIMGANKQMHSVITSECTGCELCVAPCPVDCIDMVEIEEASHPIQQQKANLARSRFQSREIRKKKEQEEQLLKHQKAKLNSDSQKENIISARKAAIQAAVLRARAKK